jgi:hypothetical protein
MFETVTAFTIGILGIKASGAAAIPLKAATVIILFIYGGFGCYLLCRWFNKPN